MERWQLSTKSAKRKTTHNERQNCLNFAINLAKEKKWKSLVLVTLCVACADPWEGNYFGFQFHGGANTVPQMDTVDFLYVITQGMKLCFYGNMFWFFVPIYSY